MTIYGHHQRRVSLFQNGDDLKEEDGPKNESYHKSKDNPKNKDNFHTEDYCQNEDNPKNEDDTNNAEHSLCEHDPKAQRWRGPKIEGNPNLKTNQIWGWPKKLIRGQKNKKTKKMKTVPKIKQHTWLFPLTTTTRLSLEQKLYPVLKP